VDGQRTKLGVTLGTIARTVAASVALLVAAVVLFGAGGCQAIVTGEVPAFRCSGTALDACPAGQYCKGSGCAPCEATDVCDRFDNDCNGKVDDGPLSDADGDGYSFCGGLDEEGRSVDVDCDDTDPTVNPGAEEVCNGRDDNCDGIVDDVCEEGFACAPELGECIADAENCQKRPCPAPQICDPGTLRCLTPNAEVGQRCAGAKSCKSEICGDGRTLGQPIVEAAGGNVCTVPCCTSRDCPNDFVCLGAGTGGNYCVSKVLVATQTLGSGGGGDTCTRDADCRSGACDTGRQRCIDTCCKHDDCANGDACTRRSFRSRTTFACGAPPGTREDFATCTSNNDCRSGVCAAVGVAGRCVPTCCGSDQCATVDAGFGVRTKLLCAVTTTSGNDRVPTCIQQKRGSGTGGIGTPCTTGSQCASDRCYIPAGGGGGCTDVCCKDSDCGGSGWVCRPIPVGDTGFYLRCVPP
jgi:hypothetical protein